QLKEEVSVNLTPLIDVEVLLLIFFMVTTTFRRDTNLLITLPEAEGQPADVLPEQIDIMIARNGSYSVNGQALINTRPETLQTAIREVSAGDTSLPLVITADAESTHQ